MLPSETTNENAIAVHGGPRELYRVATDVAGVCGEIVKKTAKLIQKKKYVCIEGWQAIATAHGCMLSIESVVEDEEGNVTTIASVRRMSDGAMLTKGEGFVGADERTWMQRPRYARRAMAQTRAMSRAARSAFAHVVVLIDSGLSTTPAEEMMEIETIPSPERAPAPISKPPAIEIDPNDAMTDPNKFAALIDEAFEGRDFHPDDRARIVANVCKSKRVNSILHLDLDQRRKMLAAIVDGKFDASKKHEVAPA